MSRAAVHRRAYNTDRTDRQWEMVERELPAAPEGGRGRTVNVATMPGRKSKVANATFSWTHLELVFNQHKGRRQN